MDEDIKPKKENKKPKKVSKAQQSEEVIDAASLEAESFLEYFEEKKPNKQRTTEKVVKSQSEKAAEKERSRMPGAGVVDIGHSGESLLRMRGEEGIEKAGKIIEERMPKEKRKRFTKALKIILFIVLLLGSIVVVYPIIESLMQDGVESATLYDLFKNMDIGFFVLAITCTLIFIIINGVRTAYITKITSKKFAPLKCTRIAMLGKFYDNVTPLSTGGQPFEIYELNKMGIPGGVATAIPLIRYFVQMFTITPVCLLLFIFNSQALSAINPAMATTVSIFAYIGMGVFMIVPVFLIFVTIMPKFGMKCASFFVKIGKKLKIVKDYDATLKKAAKMVSEFKTAMKYVTAHPLHLLVLFLLTLVETVVTYIVPFFLCVAFGDAEPSWQLLFQTLTFNAYAYFAVSFMPTPGNAGFAETVFALVFTGVAFAGKNPMVWVVLMWRFLTYYVFIIIGLFIILYDIIKSRIIKYKNKKHSGGDSGGGTLSLTPNERASYQDDINPEDAI